MEAGLIINLILFSILTVLLIVLSVDEAKREKQECKDKQINVSEFKKVA